MSWAARILGRHDTRIAILGTAILTGGYYFGIVAPGRQDAQRIQQEIEAAQARMMHVPVMMEQRTQLLKRLTALRDQQPVFDARLPLESHASVVLRHVAGEAQRSGLSITRLEPLPSVAHATYSAHPFQLSCRGTFADIAGFLAGLESHERLLTFGKIDFQRGSESAVEGGRTIQANFEFHVYSRHAEFTKVAENASSPSPR